MFSSKADIETISDSLDWVDLGGLSPNALIIKLKDIKSDIFIAKSDIIYIIKKEIVDIDAIDIYILSEENEIAIKQGFYIKQNYTYNPLTGVYDIYNEKITLFDGDMLNWKNRDLYKIQATTSIANIIAVIMPIFL